jgi:hypothetical protein
MSSAGEETHPPESLSFGVTGQNGAISQIPFITYRQDFVAPISILTFALYAIPSADPAAGRPGGTRYPSLTATLAKLLIISTVL